MKKIILLSSVFVCAQLLAQPTLINQAIVHTTTTIVAPEGSDDVTQLQNQGGEGRMMFRNFADGEIKSTTYLKGDLVKTVVKTEMGRITTIRDNAAKKTTTLMEMMGNKTGFYATDEDEAEMRRKRDSMMRANQNDSSRPNRPATENAVEIVETGETKKIAGYNAKKVWVVTSRLLGIKDTAVAWYSPEIKLVNMSTIGGSSFGNFGAGPGGSVTALSKLEGMVLRYESKMRNNRTMTVEVTKLETSKEIATKEFDIQKDFEVKPMKEMQGMRFGGGPGGGGGDRIFIRQ